MRPRATASLAIVPATVTDRSAPAVLGLEERAYRELVARERVPHALVGRRVVARVEDVLAALDRIARRQAGSEVADQDSEPAPSGRTTGADRILARIGRVRSGGAR
jgi:hypothetical protein